MSSFQPADRVFDTEHQRWATFVGAHTDAVASIVYDDTLDGSDMVIAVATYRLVPAVLCCPSGDESCGRCVQLYPDDIDTSGYRPDRADNPEGLVRTTGLAARYAWIGNAPPNWDQLLNSAG